MIEVPFTQYGLKFRFVEETDAEFILSLRTDPKLSRYLSDTDADIDKQIKWIKAYKAREANNTEYYFMYTDGNDQPLGLCRLYNVDPVTKSYTSGSWLAKSGIDVLISIKADLVLMQLAFETLDLKICNIDVRKDNKKMLRYHKQFFNITHEDDGNVYLKMDYNDFKKKELYLKSIITPKSN
ncbi:GNAT family N-acetyltransferase [Mucilaginibacter pallidiroseus]|uniref:GNAT family N-acetyltransferase n=1 Tax=Mucilaginibacter pallidiroseus TaxID=2599295 RepID=A0A563U1Y3_9SPHI|nr:GNAT family N-acetyltransferase [Mucilaginibacter pallidiroseus]TWR25172.1 GNAT family N-acetyltransferase [Mucilaginibacter pallidiroseus]